MEKLKEEIYEALAAATPDWYYNGNEIVSKQNLRMGIGGFLTDADNILAANAPAWLAQQNKEILRQKHLLERAARIIDSGMASGTLRYDPREWFTDYHAGGTP